MGSMNVVVADRRADARDALNAVLSGLAGIRLLHGVDSVKGAVDALATLDPEVLVTGTELSDGDALELVSTARQASPQLRIVVIARDASREVWQRYLAAGADRFVVHDTQLEELRDVMSSLAESEPDPLATDELRLLGSLAASVVHDLNAYHHTASLGLELVETATGKSEALTRTRSAIDRASRLTKTLLGYIQGHDAETGAVDFAALVRETVDLMGRSLHPSITVRVDLAQDIPAIQGVRSDFEQLVLNLILNAAEAMPGGGELVLRVRSAGTMIYFEVSDTGTGFVEVPTLQPGGTSRSTKRGRGLGLGLGIVHRVIRRHDGRFTLAARRDRTGSIATVFLPVSSPPFNLSK